MASKLTPAQLRNATASVFMAAITAWTLASFSQAIAAPPAVTPATAQEETQEPWGSEGEYGGFLARPEELAPIPVNDIVKSMRLNAQAMRLGEAVYERSCAECHGADLKGVTARHTPDLTDNVWRFWGDDFASAGRIKFPSDVEWTVRYGVRSGSLNARGVEADMLAYDPRFRNKRDIEDFGTGAFLSRTEIAEMVEYVLQLSGQPHDEAQARRAAVLFQDHSKGNCYDCHGRDGKGKPAFGSTDLTNTNRYLYGADRATILESITKGRHSVMPAFDGVLKPEEIKAVSVFVFAQASK